MSPLAIIVCIVIVDLLGFTIVMPLLAPFAKSYQFSPAQIGLLMAAFPLCQLIAGPILGRLSDRYGRRPILILSQAGTALSFIILGLSRSFVPMLLARMLDGASGGNILVAQAYVADITKPENRARSFGLIGMAFGLGFVLGPILGLLILEIPVAEDWRLRLPFLFAAAFSVIALALVWFKLPESRVGTGSAKTKARVLSIQGLTDTLILPGVGRLVLVGSLDILAFAALEATFSLYLREQLGWTAKGALAGFTTLGFVSAMTQGGLIRRIAPIFGEAKLIVAGLIALSVGLACVALATNAWLLIPALILVGVGQGIASPSISGLLSRTTPPDEQGAVFGAFTSAQTLARMINYLLANLLLGWIGPAAPFWEGAALAVLALGIFLALKPRNQRSRNSPPIEEGSV